MPATSLTDEEIVARCKSGELLDDIGHLDADSTDPDSLLNCSIRLHNDQQIDLLSLTKTALFNSLTASEFFLRQNFFCEAIPKLETPTLPLMEAVEALVAKGGSDLAAKFPNEAFRNRCAANLTQAHAIVTDAQGGDQRTIAFVTYALIALADTDLARSFVDSFTDARRLSALFVLGRIKPINSSDAEQSINALLPFIDAMNDEASRCNALLSLLELCKQFPSLTPAYVPRAIAVAILTPTKGLLFNLAHAIWHFLELLDRTSLEATLNALKATEPSLGGIISQIDFALAKVLATPNSDLALDFLTDVLALGRGFSLKQFPSTKNKLTQDQDKLFKLVVRWLTSENSNLEAEVPQILRTGEGVVPFDTSTADLGLSERDHIFLARKALGWLFTNNVIAASILVACLRSCDAATATVLSKLLFDPLLVSYSGKARDYLKTIKKGDAAYRAVRKALKDTDKYIRGLRIDPPIKELRPSEHQLNIQRRHAHDWMREIQKSAEKQSVFFNLMHRSVLLYGRRSTTFVQEPGGKRRAIDMDLHSFSHSIELPKAEIVDPVGLSIAILSLRSSRK